MIPKPAPLLLVLAVPFAAAAQDAEPTPAAAPSDDGEVIESHAYSSFQGDRAEIRPRLRASGLREPPMRPRAARSASTTPGTFDSFNPYSRLGRAGALSSLPYESIMAYTADDLAGPYCQVCTTLRTNANQDFVEFDIHPEARFADGEPVTAEDIVFTVELFLEQGSAELQRGGGVPDRLRRGAGRGHGALRVQPRRAPQVPGDAGGGRSPSSPKHWFDETGARLDESRLEIPPGSGPYQLTSYDVNRRIVYDKNPDWWGADLPINVGRHNFDRIRVEYFGDSTAAMEGFKAGAYTFREEDDPLTWATSYDFPAVEQGDVIVEELADGNVPAASGFVLNLGREKFPGPPACARPWG